MKYIVASKDHDFLITCEKMYYRRGSLFADNFFIFEFAYSHLKKGPKCQISSQKFISEFKIRGP